MGGNELWGFNKIPYCNKFLFLLNPHLFLRESSMGDKYNDRAKSK